MGDIVWISGIENISIGDTVCAPECFEPLPFTKISEPTVVAYYFGALALGLIGGLAPGAWWVTPTFSAVLLAVIAVADSPHFTRGSRSLVMTLDVAILDRDELERVVAERVGGQVRRLDVRELDLVRDLTVLEVWYRPTGRPQPFGPQQPFAPMQHQPMPSPVPSPTMAIR